MKKRRKRTVRLPANDLVRKHLHFRKLQWQGETRGNQKRRVGNMKRSHVHLQNVGQQDIHIGKHWVMGKDTDGIGDMGCCLHLIGKRKETIGRFS